MQTCKMVNTWVKGTGMVSATSMLAFYSLECLSSTPTPPHNMSLTCLLLSLQFLEQLGT